GCCVLAGILLGHRQPDGGLHHDLPARLQGRRPHRHRQHHRRGDRETPHGDAPADAQERGDRRAEFDDHQQQHHQLQHAGRTRGLILHTTVGIGYETPWRQVEAVLRLAAERTPGLLTDPPPFVLQKSLGDFAVTYELNAYCNDPHTMGRLYSAMHRNILAVFNEHGVQIMTPAYEGDPETPKVVARDQWFQAPARPPDVPAPAGGPAPRLVAPAAGAPPVGAPG